MGCKLIGLMSSTCTKYNVYCRGTTEDKEDCPVWAEYFVLKNYHNKVEDIVQQYYNDKYNLDRVKSNV